MRASSEEVSYGAISAVPLGFSVPLQTTSTRLIITNFDLTNPDKTNIQVDQSSFCSITVDRLQMLWHLRIDDMYNFRVEGE